MGADDMKVFAYMVHGSGKAVSEDSILVDKQLLKEGYFAFDEVMSCFAVADGVGGYAGGREASEFVLNELKDKLCGDMKQNLIEINNSLISYSKTLLGKEKMATTLSLLMLSDKTIKMVHVGNTRIYAIQGMYLKQLTKDHTTVQFLRSKGDFAAADAAPKNEITSCLGAGITKGLSQIQVYEIDKDYTGYVITSDGIHDYLEDDCLEDFVSERDYSERAFEQLANLASENGSDDDKSIVIVLCRE